MITNVLSKLFNEDNNIYKRLVFKIAVATLFFWSFFTRMLEKAKDFPHQYDETDYSTACYQISDLPMANGFLSAGVFIVVCMTMDRYQ